MENVQMSPLGTIGLSKGSTIISISLGRKCEAFITANKKGQPVASGCPNAFPSWSLTNWLCQHPEGFPCESLWGIRVVRH